MLGAGTGCFKHLVHLTSEIWDVFFFFFLPFYRFRELPL